MRRIRLTALAGAQLLAARLLLRRAGLVRALRYLDSRHWLAGDPSPLDERLAAVRRASRLVPNSACLAQTVAMLGMLSSGDASPELVIGCHLQDGTWGAHAWLEWEGARVEPVVGADQVELARASRVSGWELVPAIPIS